MMLGMLQRGGAGLRHRHPMKEVWQPYGNTNYTLSSADRVIAQNSISFVTTAFVAGYLPTRGKWYAECTLSDAGTLLAYFGAKLWDGAGANSHLACPRSNATALVASGVSSATQVSWTNGQTQMVALDCDNGKIWHGANGSWYSSGDPGAGTSPYYSSVPNNGEWRLWLHADNSSGVLTATLRLSAANQLYSPPSGFNPLC
jgi:hypothetical protein